jgi:hypothetical protein
MELSVPEANVHAQPWQERILVGQGARLVEGSRLLKERIRVEAQELHEGRARRIAAFRELQRELMAAGV